MRIIILIMSDVDEFKLSITNETENIKGQDVIYLQEIVSICQPNIL